MTLTIERKKWILYRHTSNFKLLCTVAEVLKSYSKTAISREEKVRLNLKLKDLIHFLSLKRFMIMNG